MLPWQHLNGHHFVPYLMYITGAKFEYHYSSFSEIHVFSVLGVVTVTCNAFNNINFLSKLI